MILYSCSQATSKCESYFQKREPVDVVWNVNISGRKLDHFFRWSNFVVRVGIDFVQFRGQAVGYVLVIRSDIQLQGSFKEFETWQMLELYRRFNSWEVSIELRKLPGMHLSFLRMDVGRFRSLRNLKRSSSPSFSASCLKKLDTVSVTGRNVSYACAKYSFDDHPLPLLRSPMEPWRAKAEVTLSSFDRFFRLSTCDMNALFFSKSRYDSC